MRKIKLTKKFKIIIAISLALIVAVSVLSILYIKSKSTKITMKKNNKVEINSKIYNSDLIKSIKNGKIVSKKEIVDTSKLGDKKIKIKYKTFFNKTKIYSYTINIVDTKKPEIEGTEKISISQGDDVDLLTDVKVSDNSKEKIDVKIEGDYDLNKVGSYKLYYVAKDSSGNEMKKEFTLDVLEKEQKKSYQSNNSFTTSKGFKGNVIDGITYIDGILIANKSYSLPSSYYPGGLTSEFNSAFESNYSEDNDEI